jgi:hypothetical protein
MKKFLSLLVVILFAAIGAYSQAPGIFNYQGVARNSVGNVLVNKSIALRLTIRDLTPGGTIVYQEVRGATTNPFGLFNAQVGDAGATSTVGTIAGVPWGVGKKYIQVEIDPNGGSTFINIGTAQIASVPYSLYTTLAGDLVLPFNKTQADAGTLFKITNSANGSGSTSLEGLTNSLASNVSAIIGTVTSNSPGSFSAGIRGINNGNAGFGIGVWGSQNGTGWGVYGTTPGGIGVYGLSTTGTGTQGTSTSGNGVAGTSTSGIGVYGTSNTGNAGRFENTNAANGADALQAITNGTNSSWALRATSTGAQGAGIFTYNNAGGSANALRVTNNGSGAAISATASNSGSAGLFNNTNAGNTSSTVVVTSNSTTGVGLQVNQTGTSQVSAVYGNISTTAAGSAGISGADFSSGGASGIELRTYGVVGQTGTTGIGVGAYANSGGTALRAFGGGLTGYSLQSNGRVQLAGIGENLNWILRSDAAGNATWANPAVLLGPLFWSTTGNTGTVDGTNFIGNIDNVPFNIRVNNQKAGRLDQSRNNTFYGLESGSANYTTAGIENTGIGVNALFTNTTGNNNTAIGSGILYKNTTGSDNTGSGRFALYNNTTGGNNSAHGREALISNTTGSFNTGDGWDALYSNTTGSNNSATGAFALVSNTTGSNNSALGTSADVASGALTNATAIGWKAQVSTSNSLVLGSINGVNTSLVDVNVGIGTTAPAHRLHVVQNGNVSAGFFDNTNAANNAPTVVINTNGTSATALSVRGPGIWGSAMGITNTTSGMEWRTSVNGTTYTVTKVPGSTFSPLQMFSTGGLDFSASSGTSIMRLLDNGNVGVGNVAPISRLHVSQGAPGAVTIQDGTQGVGKLFFDNGAGVGTGIWSTPAAAGLVSGTGVATRVAFWNSASTISSNANLYWDDVNSRLGVGTAAPAYPLDVVHGGATGAHIASTASFSVVDIDANSGDAALRFQKAGVGRWNTRNRPADDYYEIFELGGGGSRFVIQDATGWVGIGGPGATAAPAYQLDVENGGATGIRSKSNASFSVVDIDAFSGDAALRFQKAGVGQWNTRNRPADNYYEIFELGGGGSRMVIQDGTGWVGIGGPGATAAPAYQLDVEHGGATGIRSKSNASFSVVDIDAASGDAALRFQSAGVGQWNTRNRPGDNYYEWFELGGGGSRMAIQDGTGNVGIGTTGAGIAYRLDVQHGGATGIRSQSTASFSVVDIDAASGDAALRFQFAGVGQWNTRNRPGDNYYEIFELGGGGSRMAIQDGTGNVGIGTTGAGIAYRLDVQHGGATGIRSQSTASFSVVDIDAASGDAALRYQRAGVGKWNVRNEPVADDYQVFELGGGGERMRIQRGSGNVGINQPVPAYKLDVNHGGATGIRVQSSASFSVLDIDGFSGDAALRFIRAGVNKWNTRNEPVFDDYQIFELGGGGERMRIKRGTGFVGINIAAPSTQLEVVGTITGTVKAFTIDHPLDPANKTLRHISIESPEALDVYSGNIVTDASGKAVVDLPLYFEALNKDFRYQLTVIGAFAQAIISKEIVNNKFEVATNQPNVKVSWQVQGVRNDPYMKNTFDLKMEEDKPASIKGKYYHPESYGLPQSMGVNSTSDTKGSSTENVQVSPAKVAQSEVIKGSSLEQTKITPSTNKAVDKSGSVEDIKLPKVENKPVDNSGSVAPKTEVNKTVVKPVEVKGTSLEEKPVKAVEEKKKLVVPESTKTD